MLNNTITILFPGPFARGSYALIYKWSGTGFEVFHRLPTGERAYGVKALSVDGVPFLAVARWQAQSSLIFRWNGTQFALFQEVPSKRVRYLERVIQLVSLCMRGETADVSFLDIHGSYKRHKSKL